ncbi:MAG: nitronate monooxygenase [Alphaproteobacteria bacterium]|nr:nitronate monooxygenase [Alphaproteobacteria bacterium]
MYHTVICDMLGIRYPILQGAMQGGGGVELVAAVSNAGGLGILPTFGGTEDALRADIEATRALTDKPFAVNITAMGRGFTESRARICIEMEVPVVTTGRADPGEVAVQTMKAAGITVLSVIPTVAHAVRMVEEGVDAVIASGCEAGGHVGTVATLPLVPQVVDAVDVPVLAAGGIGDARGFVAAFALGAVGVQLGTVLMATTESGLNKWGVERLVEMRETDTVVTKAMTGAPVRCIATPELLAYEAALREQADAETLSALRRAARAGRHPSDDADRRQSAAGQIAGLIHDVPPAGQLIETIMTEAVQLAESLGAAAKRG